MAKNQKNKGQEQTDSAPVQSTENTANVNINIDDIAITGTKVNEKGQTEVHTTEGIALLDAEGKFIGMKRGRPADPSSDRFKRMQEQADRKAKADSGELHLNKSGDLRGRPSNPDSARQQRLAKQTPGAKQGRPIKADSDRQKKIAERAAKMDALKALIAAKHIQPGQSLSSDELLGDME